MSYFTQWRRGLIRAALLLPLVGSLAAAQSAHAVAADHSHRGSPHPACTAAATRATPTVEELRLVTPRPDGGPSVGAQILTSSGLNRMTDDFASALCQANSLGQVRKLVATRGTALWNLAVARAQGRVAVAGTLAGNDDRPLYWARLAMTLALRQWNPQFGIRAGDRSDLQNILERSTRGMTSTSFGSHHGVHRVFISGFDPFFLDVDERQGNPSGAIALALDGQRWTANGETFEVQAVVFPVRYADFDQGMAEQVYRPVFTPGTSHSADMYATVSQGRPGTFDVELYNGRRRSTTAPDNLNAQGGGTFTAPTVFPNVGPGPEFVPTTLPVAQIFMATNNGPWPVRLHSSVVEIPAGGATPVSEATGPTSNAEAVEGGGGGYLSNEIAYRASLLRDVVGSHVYGGHIHTPVLDFGPGNTDALTDPTFEHNRTAMIDQFRSMVEAMVLR